MTGPNQAPTLSVPCCWKANRPTSTATAIGTTYGSKTGVATRRPSTALSTEMAGRDDAVAEEQRRAEQPGAEDEPRAPALRLLGQRHQRQHAALAAVVGAHDEQHVLDGDDQDQRPQDQRQQAEHVLRRDGEAVRLAEAFLQRVERAGADVAVDDADCGERQAGEVVLPGVSGSVRVGRGSNGLDRRRREGGVRFGLIGHDGLNLRSIGGALRPTLTLTPPVWLRTRAAIRPRR